MSFADILCLVLAAVYALMCLLLSIGIALSWHAGLARRSATANELLALRLFPALGAAFFTLTVALPAFLIHEPQHRREPVGPLLVSLAAVALSAVGSGIWRGVRAWAATRALLRRCAPVRPPPERAGRSVEIIDVPEPLVAVVGAWRPRILAAECVRAALSDEEFRQLVAHEAAHVSTRDNLKLLLQRVSPDALAWMPTGTDLTQRWRAAAELEADARASGLDARKRLALASVLLKVARLYSAAERRSPALGSCALSMRVALDDVAGRVRRLLAPLPMPQRRLPLKTAIAYALLIAVGVLLHDALHPFIESLVAFGTRYDGW